MPFYFDILGLRISGYRFVLLIFFIPALVRWLDGSDRVRKTDILVICLALWNGLAITVNHGLTARWEFIGIGMIETMAPYFIARWMIRDAHAFRIFALWMLIVIALMLPFSLHQFFTDKSVLLEFFGKFVNTYPTVHYEPRLGYYRAQGSMPHPILFGVFCSVVFALIWYVLGYGKSVSYKISRLAVGVGAVFVSLSSGAYLAVMVQIILMGWKAVFATLKKKWNLLLYIFAGMYIFIEIFSTRSPAQIFAAYLTLNKSTAWNRIHIFTFASDDVMNNPLFGIGLKEWSRPRWMLSSIDNFWLVVALRQGFPSLILLVATIIFLYRDIGRAPLTGKLASYRLGYLFSLAGLCIAALTVHLWDATFCLLMFMLGAGVWLIDAKDETAENQVTAPRDRQIRYTRFG